MNFSTEELDFISNVFAEEPTDVMSVEQHQNLGLQSNIPSYLTQVLAGSKLTLLAKISHYQLWFPVTLSFNEQNDFVPILGTPEIIDVNGQERSWRVNTPENIEIINSLDGQHVEILSLSSTGLTLKAINKDDSLIDLQHCALEMTIADELPMKLDLDLVRSEKNVVAAKFKDLQEGREALRKFLFNSHKTKYSNLYQDVIL